MESLRIGEVARRTGLTVRALRHYDELGLLVPSERGVGDYRLYDEDDLRRLLAISHLKSLGLSLDEIGRALDDPSFDTGEALDRHIAVVQERLDAERELLLRLRRLRGTSGWEDVVAAIALAESLRHPEAAVRFRAALEAPTSVPVETLVERLVDDPNSGVREVLTWAVVRHGGEATGPLLARLRHRDPAVRLQMAHALSKLGDAAAVTPLVALLNDPVPEVAAKAAFALGRLGGAEAQEALVGALGHGQPLVRDAVTTALAPLGESVVAAVSAVLASPSVLAREQAAEVLGYLQSPDSVSALAPAVRDENAGVRMAALMALGGIAGESADAALAEAVSHPDERTSVLATRLLSDRRAAASQPR